MPDESERVTVSTYVPAPQRDIWREEAERLGMSQSEFLRTMVQAGRRGFSLDGGTPEEPCSSGPNPRGNELKTAVLELLRREDELSWGDIAEDVLGGLEDDLEAALIELQEANRIQHSPREGSYSLAGSDDGE